MVVRYFKLFLFLSIIFLAPTVFAYDYDVTNIITSPVGDSSAGGKYTGTELNGATNAWNVNTRYQGTLQRIRFNIPLPSNWLDGDCYAHGNTYTITMHMATEDWRNRFGTVKVLPYSSYTGNFSNGKVTFVSYKKIYFTFTIPNSYETCLDFVYIDLPSTGTTVPFTGETNWNLSKIVLTDPAYSSGGSGGSSGGSGGSTGPTNQDIIDNNTENTNNIISNNNNNTENIIENNNSNTEDIIESQQEINDTLNSNCKTGLNFYDVDTYHYVNGYINSDGLVTSNPNYRASPFFKIKGGETYTINVGQARDVPYFCWYYGNKGKISCTAYNNTRQFTVTAPDNAVYLRVTSIISAGQFIPVSIVGPICNDWNLENQNNINDTITNSNVDNDVGNGFFDDFSTDDNGGISAFVTAPLSLVRGLLSHNNSCDNLTLPPFLGVSNASLPSGCIFWNRVNSTIVNLWNILVSAPIAYFILKDLYFLIEKLKDPYRDRIDILDL